MTAATRPAAVSLLIRVLDHGQTLDEALLQDEVFDMLDGSDRGLARAIASAALRHLGRLDRLIDRHVTGRPFRELDRTVQHLLRIGAAQITILKTPTHAAVSETVNAARDFDASRRAGGLINAVLRKIDGDSLDRLGLPPAANWPRWFQSLLNDALGAGLADIAEASLHIAPLDLTVPKDRPDWASRLEAEAVGPDTLRLHAGGIEQLPGFAEGAWWVQDVAATLPVHLLSPRSGEHILDLCAAPGGKTLQISAKGAEVTAIDRSAKRLQRVKENLERTGLNATCIAADATKWKAEELFDAALVDAPCSALGTLRRHPEGPWIRREDDFSRFPDIQFRLLTAAAKGVKEGGRMVYCVCTPLPREGVDIVDRFLGRNPDWRRVPPSADELGEFAPALTDEGDVLTMPPLLTESGGCDVFYIARLEHAPR